MKLRTYIITAVLAYGLFLITLTPASAVISLLDIPAKQVKFHGVRGTLWNGTIDNVELKKQTIKNLHWDLNGWALFAGSLSSRIDANVFDNKVSTDIALSLFSQSITISDLDSVIFAKDLQQQLDLPFGELGGTIKIHFDEIAFTDKTFPNHVLGKIDWSNAKLTFGNDMNFGNIKLDLNTDDKGKVIGKLNNDGGDLTINGDLDVTDKGQYKFNARLKPRANAPQELVGALKMIAPKQQKGEHLINRRGNLRQLGIKL